MKGRPGVILGSPYSLFSESTGLVFHTCILFVEFLISYFPLQRVTARDSWVSIVFELELWIMLLFGGFFLLPCLRAPGRGVPGFLAGPALAFAVGCAFMIQI